MNKLLFCVLLLIAGCAKEDRAHSDLQFDLNGNCISNCDQYGVPNQFKKEDKKDPTDETDMWTTDNDCRVLPLPPTCALSNDDTPRPQWNDETGGNRHEGPNDTYDGPDEDEQMAPPELHPFIKRQSIPGASGAFIQEMTLSDGTKCAVFVNGRQAIPGGITCQWKLP